MQAVIVPHSNSAGLQIQVARISMLYRLVGENNFSHMIDPNCDTNRNIFTEQVFECNKKKKDGTVCHEELDSQMVHVGLCTSADTQGITVY